jgi:outer membrane lipoprotein-sorting protein
MKMTLTIITALFISSSVFAQTPEIMSYQAIVRDASNKLLSTQSVGMQISIIQGSASGSSVYVETQIPTSNMNGLVSIEIGN